MFPEFAEMNGARDRTVTLSFPQDWVIETETTLLDNNGHIVARVPILIPGVEVKIDVTDLMTPGQCEKFAKRLADKVSEISVRQLQTDFFTHSKL
jgi:hypothetical protein